jgi:hypothetical protein
MRKGGDIMEEKNTNPKLIPTAHFWERYNERIGKLMKIDRIFRQAKQKGVWFLDENGTYVCVVNNLMVLRVVRVKTDILLLTVYPYTQKLRGYLNKMERVSNPLQNN